MTSRYSVPDGVLIVAVFTLMLLGQSGQAFTTAPRTSNRMAFTTPKPAFVTTRAHSDKQLVENKVHEKKQQHVLGQIWNRMDTLKSAGLVTNDDDKTPLLARGGGLKAWVIFLTVAWCYKWYRARFINKIPVWDRQPQWNMVITSKEQEKDLRAYTCKNCGSTLFIAKNREWFFEGNTGLAGLGCYACGAKGEDNFVMDRDRIVEDVADIDDYFDYERPLDFVSAAERRAVLKKAKGDEDVANQMLMDQAATETSDQTKESTAPPPFTSNTGLAEKEESADEPAETEAPSPLAVENEIVEAEIVDATPEMDEPVAEAPVVEDEKPPPLEIPTPPVAEEAESEPDPDDLGALGLDDF